MSTEQISISVSKRDIKTKGHTNRLRKEGNIPGIVYGGATQTPVLAVLKTFPKGHTKTGVVELDFGSEKKLAIMRQGQVDPITNAPLHVDFQEIQLESVVSAYVPLQFVGLTREQEKEGMFKALRRSVLVRGKVKDLPTMLEVNVSSLKVEDSLHASSLTIPAGVKLRVASNLPIASLLKV